MVAERDPSTRSPADGVLEPNTAPTRTDVSAPTLRGAIALHDHWILEAGDTTRKQWVGGPWDSCVLATVTLSEGLGLTAWSATL